MAHQPYKDIIKRDYDFRVKYRIYSHEEGGRRTPVYQGIRWDFWYESDKHTSKSIYIIWPEFEDENKDIFLLNEPVPTEGTAQMWIISKDMIDYHIQRVEVGAKGYFHEGARRVGECEIIETNFFKTVTLKFFKKKHHNRVAFTKLLLKYKPEIGLKGAKELLDEMIDGQPIDYKIEEHKLLDFQQELEGLQLEYEIK